MITEFISLCIASYCINGCANGNVRNLAIKKSGNGSGSDYIEIHIPKNGKTEYKAISFFRKGDIGITEKLKKITFDSNTIKFTLYYNKGEVFEYKRIKNGEYQDPNDKDWKIKLVDKNEKKIYNLIEYNTQKGETYYYKIIDNNNREFEKNYFSGTLWKLDIKI